MERRRYFTVFWKTGEIKIICGFDRSHALRTFGIKPSEFCSIDFTAEGDKRDRYSWNEKAKEWVKKKW